jgi:hypothetical protein
MSKKFILFTVLLITSICFLQNAIEVSAACTEKGDIGKNASVLGTINYNGREYTDRCNPAYPRYVLEYYCDDTGRGIAEWMPCSSNCSSGICAGGTTTTPTTCTSNWQPSAWSACDAITQKQTRTYTDTNNCGITTNKPADQTQICSSSSSSSSSVSVSILGNGNPSPLNLKLGEKAIYISWSSVGADYCNASSSTGYSNNWVANYLKASGEALVSITSGEGSYIYTIKCFASSGASAQANLTVNVLAPKVTLVITGPKSIVEGGSTTLSWTSENVSGCTGFGGRSIDTSGTDVAVGFHSNPHILVQTAAIFEITCKGYNKQTVKSYVSVDVFPSTAPRVIPRPTADLKANNSDTRIVIKKNQPLTLSWESSNASNCGVSSKNLYTGALLFVGEGQSGSRIINTLNRAGEEMYYTVSCSGGGGTAEDNISVEVSNENYSTVNLKINNSDGPINLPLYSSLADISWTTFGNVSSCTASCTKDNLWSGLKSNSGGTGKVGNFSSLGEYNYVISCTTPVGNISDSVLVNISSTTVDLKANNSNGPINIVSGNRVQLSWTTNQANSCTASGDTSWTGPKSVSGGPIYSDYIFSTKTFTLTCKDALNKSVTDSVIVEIPLTDCVSNWQPGAWSTCTGGKKTRSYADSNNCSPATSAKPADETQNCLDVTFTCVDNSTGISYNMKDIAILL